MNLAPYLTEFSTRTSTVVEAISDALRQAILDGELSGGAALKQGPIAKQFGVSSIPIREALLKLEGEGLVEAVPHRGFMVSNVSGNELGEILEMRYALEALALDLAVPRFSAQDQADALEIVADAQAGMPPQGHADFHTEFESRWGKHNWIFHRRIYSVANRPRLLSWIENLQHLFACQLRRQMSAQGGKIPQIRTTNQSLHTNRHDWKMALEEHRQMALACGRHDIQAAKDILQAHVFNHGRKLVQMLYGKCTDLEP